MALLMDTAALAINYAGTLASGDAAYQAGKYQAKQLRQRANEERAVGQREAMEKERETRLAQSRLQAVSASSGLGASDAGILDLAGDIEERGAYLAGVERYKGENRARGSINQARATIYDARVKKKAAKYEATGTLLSSSADLLVKYGSAAMGAPSGGGGYYG